MAKRFTSLTLFIAVFIHIQAQSPVLFDLNSGAGNSNPRGMAVVNNNLIVSSRINSAQGAIWKTDGTQAGTQVVRSLVRCFGDYYTKEWILLNGKLIFTGGPGDDAEPWVTDGTTNGTVQLKDVNPYAESLPGNYALCGNKVVFMAVDTFGNPVTTYGLWVTDGTPAGTVELHQVFMQSGAYTCWPPSNITSYNNKAYFFMSDSSEVPDLWVTDGTIAGTQKLCSLPFWGHYQNTSLFIFNNNLYMAGQIDTAFIGTAIVTGTWQIDVNTPSITLWSDSIILYYGIEINGNMLFSGPDGHGQDALWTTDGTFAGSHLVIDINTGGYAGAYQFYKFQNKAYFFADDGAGNALWVSDGTANGTNKIQQFSVTEGGVEDMVACNGKLFFNTRKGTDTTMSFWYTDGTSQGITKFASETQHGGYWANMRAMDNSVYFSARLDGNGNELWKFDVTATGISELQKVLSITVFPNPATDELNFSTTNIDAVTIYNITGEKISEIKQPLNNKINVSLLTPGIYIAEVKQGNTVTRLKWAKL